jgi:hypothetical protein
MNDISRPRPRGALLNVLLWTLAVLVMFAAIVYQRRTGPTYPRRGVIATGGEEFRYKLVRSQETNQGARVALPAAGGRVQAVLHWRRYPLQEPYAALPLAPAAQVLPGLNDREAADYQDKLVALLPVQPAAGKLEYYLEVTTPEGLQRIPALAPGQAEKAGETTILLRYKDPVPSHILWPHVVLMFFSVLFGMRAGLSALADPARMRGHAWVALAGMTLGGMVLGPMVQKHAFGHYWTGFPFGSDLTDNKMLIMWLSWIFACSLIGLKARSREGWSRVIVLVAAVVMTGAYIIPHSMRGSQLDYKQLEQGVDARRAIGTSEH